MFRTMLPTDYDIGLKFIARMNRASQKYFLKAFGTDGFQGWLYENPDPSGVITLIKEDDFFLMQVSFSGDPDTPLIRATIHSIVNDVIAQKGDNDFYLNFFGENKALAQHFRLHGFAPDMTAYQFCYQALPDDSPSPPFDLSPYGLETARFDADHVDEYLLLTDEAFHSLDLACGFEPYGSSTRYREQSIASLQRRDSEGNFCAFWKGSVLVGLYWLVDDWIHTIAVHPQYQNRGIGSVMLQHAMHRLIQERTYPAVYLNCLEINKSGLHYYKKNGFSVVGYVSEHTYRPR